MYEVLTVSSAPCQIFDICSFLILTAMVYGGSPIEARKVRLNPPASPRQEIHLTIKHTITIPLCKDYWKNKSTEIQIDLTC